MNKAQMLEIPINSIKFTKNYRHTFPEKTLRELAQSIRQHGIIEPIVVRERTGGYYELIAGERRTRAAEIAGLVTVPARIVEATDAEVLELQLVENVQREVVPYYEEALALKRLQDDPYNYDVQEIAKKIGKSDQYVYYQLKLTQMCHIARQVFERGEVSKTVAWLLSREPDENIQANAATALRRENKSKLVGERAARQYLEDLRNGRFNDRNIDVSNSIIANPRKKTKKFYTPDASDFRMNWKKYLVQFTPDQFIEFKNEIGGKTDTLIWAKAVDTVMTRSEAAS